MYFNFLNCSLLLSGAVVLFSSLNAADTAQNLSKPPSVITAQDIIKRASLIEDPNGNLQNSNFSLYIDGVITYDFSKVLPAIPKESIGTSRKAVVFQEKLFNSIQNGEDESKSVVYVSLPEKSWKTSSAGIKPISQLSEIRYFRDEQVLKYPHLAILNSPEIKAAWPDGYVVQGPWGAKNFFDSKGALRKVDLTTYTITMENIQPYGDYFEPQKVVTEIHVWPPMVITSNIKNFEIRLNEPFDEKIFSVPENLPPLPNYQKEWAVIEGQRIELPQNELKPYHNFMFLAQYKLENTKDKSIFEFRIRQFMNAEDAKKFYRSNSLPSDATTRWRRNNVIMEIITPLTKRNKELLNGLKAEKNIINNYLEY